MKEIGQLHAKKRALGFCVRVAARVLVLCSCKVILFCQSLNSLARARDDRSVTVTSSERLSNASLHSQCHPKMEAVSCSAVHLSSYMYTLISIYKRLARC
jgi:hypothetical protein